MLGLRRVFLSLREEDFLRSSFRPEEELVFEPEEDWFFWSLRRSLSLRRIGFGF